MEITTVDATKKRKEIIVTGNSAIHREKCDAERARSNKEEGDENALAKRGQ